MKAGFTHGWITSSPGIWAFVGLVPRLKVHQQCSKGILSPSPTTRTCFVHAGAQTKNSLFLSPVPNMLSYQTFQLTGFWHRQSSQSFSVWCLGFYCSSVLVFYSFVSSHSTVVDHGHFKCALEIRWICFALSGRHLRFHEISQLHWTSRWAQARHLSLRVGEVCHAFERAVRSWERAPERTRVSILQEGKELELLLQLYFFDLAGAAQILSKLISLFICISSSRNEDWI